MGLFQSTNVIVSDLNFSSNEREVLELFRGTVPIVLLPVHLRSGGRRVYAKIRLGKDRARQVANSLRNAPAIIESQR